MTRRIHGISRELLRDQVTERAHEISIQPRPAAMGAPTSIIDVGDHHGCR